MKQFSTEAGAMAGVQVLGGLIQVLMGKGVLSTDDVMKITQLAKADSAGKNSELEINELIDIWISKA